MKYHIAAFHGGLGDYLQHSTLPDRLTELGHEVHLWEKAEFRNPGIRDLIMCNPFILPPVPGAEWNLGDIPGLSYKNDQPSFIGNWEAMFGLTPKNDLPKIYYEPKIEKLGQLKHCKFEGIIELSAISGKYNPQLVIANVLEYIMARNDVNWVQISNGHQSNRIEIPGIPQLEISDIFKLCDCIADCKIFLSLHSGSHSLAAAIQRINPHFEQICFYPHQDERAIMDSQKFVYKNIEYYPT